MKLEGVVGVYTFGNCTCVMGAKPSNFFAEEPVTSLSCNETISQQAVPCDSEVVRELGRFYKN